MIDESVVFDCMYFYLKEKIIKLFHHCFRSQACSGLCSIPQGYTSRCEQRYVQKRLVALEGSGNQLYTDVFWFPSCCLCTISNT